MAASIRRVFTLAVAATLMASSSATAADDAPRLFASHALALRAAGVVGEKRAEAVVMAMPGAGMMGDVSPEGLWGPFFSNAVVKLGRLDSPGPVAFYYNPLLDVAVITFWEKRDGGYRVRTARAAPGERLADPDVDVPLLPSWLSAKDGLVNALASTTTARLEGFRAAHSASAREAGRDTATFASAAAGMRAVLPRLVWNAAQRSGWTEQARPWLAPAAAAVEQALGARDAGAVRAAAPDTDEETASTLAELPAAFAAGLALDMVIEDKGDDRLLIGSLLEDGDTYVLIRCRQAGDACELRRFILASLIE